MELLKKDFDKLFRENKLALSLIGMSNVGKTFWSKKLAKLDFEHIGCDDLIETKLVQELKNLGYSGIKDVSRWMGQPYEKKYIKNQQKYLSLEKKTLKEIFLKLKNKKNNIVLDTTGSVVHCGDKICKELKKHTLVVYIKADDSLIKKMLENYIQNPKPVIWGNVFKARKNETNKRTLERCYTDLLKKRNLLYNKYSHIIISSKILQKTTKTKDFINLIKESL